MRSSVLRDAVHKAILLGVFSGVSIAGAAFASSAMASEPQQSTGAAGSAAPSASSSTAATQTQLKAVEVTGTRIKRTNVEQAQPIQVITAAQIQDSGMTTIGEVLKTITNAGGALNTQANGFGNGTTSGFGAVNLDLRNLGSSRLLVLVDGHRWATDLNGTVDLSTIPTSIIDHIEILEDGASSIYGSDAISGVVNIITVKNFDGAKANAYVGEYHGDGHWDGLTKQASATIGTSNSHGGITLNISYQDVNPISSADRTISQFPHYGTGNTRGSASTPQGTFKFIPPFSGSGSSVVPDPSTGLTSAQCPAKNFGSPAKPNYMPFCYLTIIPGTAGTSPSDYTPFLASDNYNFAPSNYLLTPEQTYDVYAAGHYDLADNLTFSVTLAESHRNSAQQAAPSIVTFGPSSNVDLPANTDFNPFNFALSTSAPIGPGELQHVGRRVSELGPRYTTENNDLSHFNGGFNGFVDVGSSEWDWDAGYTFSKVVNLNQSSNRLDGSRIDEQMNPAVCALLASQGCVPINFFGGQGVDGTGSITPAQFKYAEYINQSTTTTAMRSVYGDVTNSDIADLPAGPVGLAFGYQYIGNTGTFTPDVPAQLAAVNPEPPTSGKTSSNAAYVEVDVPLLANKPLAHLVDLDVASRRTKAEAAGNVNYNTSSRAGLKWQPTDDLLIRGTWSQGFRAPNISELFAAVGGNSFQGVDPCSSYESTGVPANVQQACIAGGVPPSYVQTLNQLSSQEGGNTHLKPETSISRTVGFVYSPDWLPGFNFNADYFKIELEGTIQAFGGQNILDGCYIAGDAADCARIVRQPTGDLKTIDDSVTNIGGTLTEGADIGATYAFPATSFGQFQVGLQSTYTREYNQFFPSATGNGFVVTKLAGINRGSDVFPLGIPRWKANGNVDWSMGNWKVHWQIQYIGPMIETCSDYLNGTPVSYTNLGLCTYPDFQNNTLSLNRFAATVYHNAQVTYSFEPINTSLTFGIRNLFNKEPPVSTTAQLNNYDFSNYPVPGRFFYASVGVKF